MSRYRLTSIGVVVVLIVLLIALFTGNVVQGERPKIKSKSKIGIVDMDRLLDNHPLTKQIKEIDKSIANYNLTLKNEVENLNNLQKDTKEYLGDFNSQLNKRLELVKDNSMKQRI